MPSVAVLTNTGPPRAVPIVLDTDYKPMLRGFRAAAAGDVGVINHNGTAMTIAAVLAGETVRGQFQQVTTTGTTVTSPTTNLMGLQ